LRPGVGRVAGALAGLGAEDRDALAAIVRSAAHVLLAITVTLTRSSMGMVTYPLTARRLVGLEP